MLLVSTSSDFAHAGFKRHYNNPERTTSSGQDQNQLKATLARSACSSCRSRMTLYDQLRHRLRHLTPWR